ncbi:MAG: ribosome small subunit-dependent GTPase A, partial [Epsilonproteobacteria bacterium]
QREFDVKILKTGEIVQAKALGNLLKKGETVVVGDVVTLKDVGGQLEIHGVDARENEIFRIIVREQRKKVTAANCNALVIISSVSKPAFKRGIIDRFLVRAYQWGVQPVVVFNKMDEYDGGVMDIKFEASRFKFLDIDCFEISAKDENYKPKYLKKGRKDLETLLSGNTALFLGQSGVGKSKTISALAGVELKTKTVGKGGKGAHSTTWSEIIDIGPFSLIDSPGIRSFSLEDIDPDELLSCFPDLVDIAVTCKFKNCKHGEKSKGCAFKMLDPDELDSKIVLSRLESYLKIYEEISEKAHWEKNLS